MDAPAKHPICLDCIGNVHLRARFASEAVRATCEECGETGPSVELARIAEEIDEAFQPNYEPTIYDQNPGAAEIFSEIAGIDADLAWRIEQYLDETIGARAEVEDGYNIYASDGGFIRARTPMFWQEQRWQSFCSTLRNKSRYINSEAMAWLDAVFADLDSHRTWDARSVIKEIVPGGADSQFYRGRVATSEPVLRQILSQPILQIGPLPPGRGQAGRLNAAGISVFYGAVDPATCVSEIRPPVGSHVVLARFDVVRPLRLLDCEALDRLAVQANPFDPEFVPKRDRAHFLRSFSDQIARPVLPGDEELGYMPTQVVAEYLAERLAQPIDGLLFKSTQRGSALGNVMLFNRSARVEAFPHHSHFIEPWIRTIDVDSEDFDDGITLTLKEIGATEPPGPLDVLEGEPRPVYVDPLPETFMQPDFDDERPVTLRLAPETISVEFIRATDYNRAERRVTMGSPWPDPEG
ncbi:MULTISPECIES: RES family NAD+ phosphorylase [unclassified Sphingobium]|uniref:RES family NAD+ phosphorylase n=1 Tax=unclassified Sphingobium TaxID=2611147 RepID=UPI0035A70E16